ncbi:ribonuclease-like [Lepidochelys kempii]|uniref:ribonuclease-like n=1 Tax=Lepidochelys kempii TaxID=8472 RepID=UPI003C702BC7
MTVRRPHLRLLLPLILLATCLALARGQSWTRLKNRFREHHVDFPERPADFPDNYCEMMMFKRGVYGTFIHTFIHAPTRSLKGVCSVGGIHVSTGLHRSIFHFTVTTSKYDLQIGSYTEKKYSWNIVIGCWSRLPVLYVE